MDDRKSNYFEAIERKKPSAIRKLLIAAFLIVCVIGIQQVIFGIIDVEARQNLRMTDMDIGLNYGFDTQASFYSSGGRHFFFSTRDGVQSISSNGDIRWHHGFSMARPEMVGRGDVVAIAEKGGQSVYVLNSSGLMYMASLPNPLLYFTVNPSGYLAVIVRTEIGYTVIVYSPNRPDTYIYRAPLNDSNVFPFSVDVSFCGTYIVKALVDVNTLLFSRLTFSYVRRVDSRGMPDGLFAAYDLSEQLIVRSRFTECGKVIVVTDTQILAYEPGTQGLLWSIPFNNRPDKLYIGERGFVYITGEPFLNSPNAVNPGTLHIYNFDGQALGTYYLERRASHLSMGHNTVLAGAGRTFFAIDFNGRRLWTYTTMQDVRQMLFLENTDTILQAGSIRATVLRRLRSN